MDNSKIYIKMCKKAEEIQELRKHGEHDYYGNTSNGIHRCWLPRQDQLQEMVWRENAQHTLLDFYNGAGGLFNEGQKYWLQFISMEQLWLAFVMKEKYNKVWNGKEWIKSKGGK